MAECPKRSCLSAGLGYCSCNLSRQPLSEAVSPAVLGAHCFDHVLVHLHSENLPGLAPSLQSMVLVTESKSHHHVLNCLLFAPLAFPAGDRSRAPAQLAVGRQQPDLGMCEHPSAAMPGTAWGSTGCSVPNTLSSWLGISVSRRALWAFHLCREVPPAPQAPARPQGQLSQFVVSASPCEWAESPAQLCGVPVASSCAVFQQLLCLFTQIILVPQQCFSG